MKHKRLTRRLLCLILTFWFVSCGPSPDQQGEPSAETEPDAAEQPAEAAKSEPPAYPPDGSKPVSEIAALSTVNPQHRSGTSKNTRKAGELVTHAIHPGGFDGWRGARRGAGALVVGW